METPTAAEEVKPEAAEPQPQFRGQDGPEPGEKTGRKAQERAVLGLSPGAESSPIC